MIECLESRMGRAAPTTLPPPLWLAKMYWPRKDVPRFRPTEITNQVVTRARVNHGRWIADCPFCPSAQLASRTDPRFFCSECLMDAIDHRMIYVLWPDPLKVSEIERLLERRDAPEHQNWWPHESLDDLIAENATAEVR